MNNKLLILCPGYPSFQNPTNGIFTHRSVQSLMKLYDVEVVHFSAFTFSRLKKNTHAYEGVTVHRVPILQLPNFNNSFLIFLNSYLLSFFLPIIFSKKWLNSFDYFHSTMLFPISFGVSKLLSKLGKTHIAQGIGNDVNSVFVKLSSLNCVSKRFKLIDYFQFNSKALELLFIYNAQFKTNTFVLYRGVDLDLFYCKEFDDVKNESIKFLFLGGLQLSSNIYSTKNFKGIHVVLKSWSKLDLQNLNVDLILGGPGLNQVFFSKWLKTLKYPGKVTFVSTVNPLYLSALLRKVDVVLIPSLSEGLPNLANESQASGTLVIASNVGGIPESVIDGYSGFLNEAGDIDGFVNAMKKVIDNPEILKEYGENGSKYIKDSFTWENYNNKLAEKFTKLK